MVAGLGVGVLDGDCWGDRKTSEWSSGEDVPDFGDARLTVVALIRELWAHNLWDFGGLERYRPAVMLFY